MLKPTSTKPAHIKLASASVTATNGKDGVRVRLAAPGGTTFHANVSWAEIRALIGSKAEFFVLLGEYVPTITFLSEIESNVTDGLDRAM